MDIIIWCRNKDCKNIDTKYKGTDKNGWYAMCKKNEICLSKEGKCENYNISKGEH